MASHQETGHAHVRKMLDEIIARQRSDDDHVENGGGAPAFCQNVNEYDWKYIDKAERLVPYYCADDNDAPSRAGELPPFPTTRFIKWKKHNVWIVEGALQRGESNVLALRRFYIDAESWLILMGEGYDDAGNLTCCYMVNRASLPESLHQGQWYRIR